MTNTAEYKNYLFVKVPEDASGQIDLVGTVGTMELKFIITKITNGKPSFHNKYIILPPGSYQIIGKGDQLKEQEWHLIVDVIEGDEGFYENFDHTNFREVTAIDSSKTLLKSLGMEPGTTLVLKKQP